MPDTDADKHNHTVIFEKNKWRQYNEAKMIFSTNGAEITEHPHEKTLI